MIWSEIRERIRARREELGYTQERVADMAGISRPMYNMLENGERGGSLETWEAIFSSLGLLLQITTEDPEVTA